jgi:hypothetical protein
MQYLLLICDDPAELERLSAAERTRLMADYRAFIDDIRAAGIFRAGNALAPVTTATTVRRRAGKRLVTDGPFAESKEHLVGYYLIDAKDLDEAIAVAGRIPSVHVGAVEVRPLRRAGCC